MADFPSGMGESRVGTITVCFSRSDVPSKEIAGAPAGPLL